MIFDNVINFSKSFLMTQSLPVENFKMIPIDIILVLLSYHSRYWNKYFLFEQENGEKGKTCQ